MAALPKVASQLSELSSIDDDEAALRLASIDKKAIYNDGQWDDSEDEEVDELKAAAQPKESPSGNPKTVAFAGVPGEDSDDDHHVDIAPYDEEEAAAARAAAHAAAEEEQRVLREAEEERQRLADEEARSVQAEQRAKGDTAGGEQPSGCAPPRAEAEGKRQKTAAA